MARHVERGEGTRGARALAARREPGPRVAAAEARRVALLAMRQVEVPIAEETRLCARPAPARSRPTVSRLDSRRGDRDIASLLVGRSPAGRAWTRSLPSTPAERYTDVLDEAIARLDQRDAIAPAGGRPRPRQSSTGCPAPRSSGSSSRSGSSRGTSTTSSDRATSARSSASRTRAGGRGRHAGTRGTRASASSTGSRSTSPRASAPRPSSSAPRRTTACGSPCPRRPGPACASRWCAGPTGCA